MRNGEFKVINGIKFTCRNSGDCCRENEIPVTEDEVLRIQDHGWELDQFLVSLTPVSLPGKTKGARIKAFILKKKPFTRDCVFLDEKNYCKIHEYKPFACQMYPFSYEVLDDFLVEVRVHPQSVCSNVQYVLGEKGESIGILQEVYQRLKEKFLREQ
ncbi:MAG: YkgJ family cysteine cluster protein [Methanobacteriota archaeon]|nr:MAG: YkgJ family cysteine cluster protein [Euryarchaeota archaeon]